MPRYLLHHTHRPQDCGTAFTAFAGHDSPLRHRPALGSCRSGGHALWWVVEAPTKDAALALLPFYVARRTTAAAVTEIDIP